MGPFSKFPFFALSSQSFLLALKILDYDVDEKEKVENVVTLFVCTAALAGQSKAKVKLHRKEY